MIIRHTEYQRGYNQLTSADDTNINMEFGIIKLDAKDMVKDAKGKERAILLIQGDVLFEYNGIKENVKRGSFLDENPVCIHLPKDAEVKITAIGDSKLAFQAVYNDNMFTSKIYTQEECVTEQFGKGVMGETSLRYVRTVIDDHIAPYSNLVIGEVINMPGKWSSYPPHHHVQPEIYYYIFYPEQGFGFSCEGEDVAKVYSGDTAVIKGGRVHPQVAAPGYAMYYIWMIPHVPERWKLDRQYLEKDAWLLDNNAKIWPQN
ncbi:MAG: 5-deoxy-glucuronate isomerase [Eubacteriales bacterium]|nr:5-deoxy-glucuronate isomerase [Eubacteriales bacterium]